MHLLILAQKEVDIIIECLRVLLGEVGVFKVVFELIGMGDNIVLTHPKDTCQQATRYNVGDQDPIETHPSTQHCYKLGVLSHPRGKENNGYERKERPHQPIDPRNKGEVVLLDDLKHSQFGIDKLIDLLTKVNNNRDQGDHQHRKEEAGQILLDDIEV